MLFHGTPAPPAPVGGDCVWEFTSLERGRCYMWGLWVGSTVLMKLICDCHPVLCWYSWECSWAIPGCKSSSCPQGAAASGPRNLMSALCVPLCAAPTEPLLCKFADGGQKKRQSQSKYPQNGRPWHREGEVRRVRGGASTKPVFALKQQEQLKGKKPTEGSFP